MNRRNSKSRVDRLLEHLWIAKEPVPMDRLMEDLDATRRQIHAAIRNLRDRGFVIIDDMTKKVPHYYLKR